MQQQSTDAQHHLHRQGQQQQAHGQRGSSAPATAIHGHRENTDQQHQQVGEHAVVELHGGDILEHIQPGRRARVQAAGNKGITHQRPGTVGKSRPRAGHQAAGQDHQEQQPHQHQRPAPQRIPPRRRPRPRGEQQFKSQPQHIGVDSHRQPEVGGQAILADPGIIHQAALHHIPAQQALAAAEEKQQPQPGHQAGPDCPAPGKIQQG